VEVEAWHQWSPPPSTDQGAGYSAACYALAGKIDRARELILTVPQEDQWRAAGIVFNVAHPVADAGDDQSAGPIMELVLESWPNHYMALYHAGMSSYTLGERERARTHLQEFLRHYNQNDGWRSNALTVLGYLEE
jgi:thioredoxin-like negative regulator of GroEL